MKYNEIQQLGGEKPSNNPLRQIAKELETHRTEAIYNYEYRYIKEIIWDDEKNEKYGNTRKGYDRFKSEEPGYMSFGGVVSLRTNTDRDGNILGYMTETKLKTNSPLDEMKKLYEKAVDTFCDLIESKDQKTIRWWLSEEIYTNRDANGYKSAVNQLIEILNDYAYDEDFKDFIDKIK